MKISNIEFSTLEIRHIWGVMKIYNLAGNFEYYGAKKRFIERHKNIIKKLYPATYQ